MSVRSLVTLCSVPSSRPGQRVLPECYVAVLIPSSYQVLIGACRLLRDLGEFELDLLKSGQRSDARVADSGIGTVLLSPSARGCVVVLCPKGAYLYHEMDKGHDYEKASEAW